MGIRLYYIGNQRPKMSSNPPKLLWGRWRFYEETFWWWKVKITISENPKLKCMFWGFSLITKVHVSQSTPIRITLIHTWFFFFYMHMRVVRLSILWAYPRKSMNRPQPNQSWYETDKIGLVLSPCYFLYSVWVLVWFGKGWSGPWPMWMVG